MLGKMLFDIHSGQNESLRNSVRGALLDEYFRKMNRDVLRLLK